MSTTTTVFSHFVEVTFQSFQRNALSFSLVF